MTRAPARPLLSLLLLLATVLLAGCMAPPIARLPAAEREAMAARLNADVAMLASDAFGGRAPGTPGEERTLAYLEQRMGETGLTSGTNDPGSYWRMPVALVSTRPQEWQVSIGAGRREVVLSPSEAAAFTTRRRSLAAGGPETGVPVVLIGATAFEDGGGDTTFRLADLAGKLVVLRAEAGHGEAQVATALASGAVAVLMVVADEPALAVAREQRSTGRVRLAGDEADTLTAYATEAAIARAMGERRWTLTKGDADGSTAALAEIDLPVAIEASADRREFASYNLVGLLPGRVRDAGAVLLLAHWDHLGDCAPPEASDRICNGAVDNASGVAAMLELARRLKARGPHDRDIYVLATSAEEAGLLGARAFAAAPPVRLSEIVAAFNFDMAALAPAGAPLGFVGQGQTPLDPLVLDLLKRAKRPLGEPSLATDFLQRQDGWVLLQRGVPAVMLSGTFGSAAVLKPFLDAGYHAPGDEGGAIEIGGAIEDILFHEALVTQIADAARYKPAAPRP